MMTVAQRFEVLLPSVIFETMLTKRVGTTSSTLIAVVLTVRPSARQQKLDSLLVYRDDFVFNQAAVTSLNSFEARTQTIASRGIHR
jgi:hypothetical protein